MFLILLLVCSIPLGAPRAPPYNPVHGTWLITDYNTGEMLTTNATVHGVVTLDLCILLNRAPSNGSRLLKRALTQSSHPEPYYYCGNLDNQKRLQSIPWYLCPKTQYQHGVPDVHNSQYCSSSPKKEFFCYSWKCVTISNWNGGNVDEHLCLTQITPSNCTLNQCNLMTLRPKFPTSNIWKQGLHYGIRLWTYGYNPGNAFTIQFILGPSQQAPIRPIGPLAPHPPPLVPRTLTLNPSTAPSAPQPQLDVTGHKKQMTDFSAIIPQPVTPPPSDPFSPLHIAFQFLNYSTPDLTTDCWLCLPA